MMTPHGTTPSLPVAVAVLRQYMSTEESVIVAVGR
jgi:hypothetical protein